MKIGGRVPAALAPVLSVLALAAAAWGAPGTPLGIARSQDCIDCHRDGSPGIVEHWQSSGHAARGVACFDCHQAAAGEPDAFQHEGYSIATVVTPRDCARCHEKEDAEFEGSHHARAGNILASLDNYLAETVEGSRVPFDPHSPTPGKVIDGEGQRPRQRAVGLHAVPRRQGRAPGDRRRGAHRRRLQARAGRPADQRRRGGAHRPRPGRPPDPDHGELAQHRHRPPQPRRLARLLRRLPQPARLLAAPGPAARELRQVPPRPRSSAEGDLRGVEARRRLPRPQGQDEARRQDLGARQGLLRRRRPAPPATCRPTPTGSASPTIPASASPGPTGRRSRW